jgi:hypothetical protein
MIKDNVAHIQGRISTICKRLGRDPKEITLVGITKYVNDAKIAELVDAGVAHIGENRVQDAQAKFVNLSDLSFTKHMVGHLQTNKVKVAIDLFDLIHSVDSRKIAWEIEKQAAKKNKTVNVLLQVNTAFEEQKYGLAPDEVFPLMDEAAQLPHVRILGLMTMAPLVDNLEVVGSCFRDLQKLFEQAKERYAHVDTIEMKHLSMGMTSDFPMALEAGANMLRIGRALFKE